MYQQEDEQRAGETVCVQGRNEQRASARDTEAKLQSLVHLSHAQMCAHNCSVETEKRDKPNSSCDHVRAREGTCLHESSHHSF